MSFSQIKFLQKMLPRNKFSYKYIQVLLYISSFAVLCISDFAFSHFTDECTENEFLILLCKVSAL